VLITIGVLAAIWAGVWFYFLRAQGEPSYSWKYYVCTGLFLSGLAFSIIGLLEGRIGREAQTGDVPTAQTTAVVKPTTTAPPRPS